MNISEFLKYVSQYSGRMTFEESVEDELYRVVVKCGDNVLIDRVIIKCKNEKADEIRNFVYSSVADALYEKGLSYIEERCSGV